MGSSAKTLSSAVESLLSAPEDARLELIDGEIVQKALPGMEHGDVERAITTELSSRFQGRRRDDGTGGWWFATEVSIHYRSFGDTGGRVLTADIAGWRRDKHPDKPRGFPVEVCPDWVCEVSHTTYKKDTTIVPETLAREGVEWYWLADIEHQCILIHKLVDGEFRIVQRAFRGDGQLRLEPFGAAALDINVLLGDDPE